MSVRFTIIGAGPGGYVAAIRAAQRGARVTVVESQEVGGTCLHWGCIPTKAIIASVETLDNARNSSMFGVDVAGTVNYDLARIRERKDKIVATQAKGIHALFKSHGITLIQGRGSLLSDDVVRAVQKDGTTQDLRSDRIIIATGSRPARLAGIEADGDTVLTSDDAVRLTSVPKSLLIIGAGVIGCEFAFIYRSLGSDVTMIDLAPRALSTEDLEISDILERELKKAKIRLITGTAPGNVRKTPDGIMTIDLPDGKELKAEKVLLSVGRAMNTEGLRLEDGGVKTGKRNEIVVDGRMETSTPGIFAIGDVTGKMMLAHVASEQGLVAVENALGGDTHMDYSAIPAGIFTRPEIGSVGLREFEAAGRGLSIKVGRFPYRALGKAHVMGELPGIIKIISDAKTDKVLGMHICGAHATDLVHEGVLAIKMGATAAQLGQMVHAHPTLAEGIREAAEDVHGMAIHLPRPSK